MSSVQESRLKKQQEDLKAAAKQAAEFAESQVSGQGLSQAEFEQKKKEARTQALAQSGFEQVTSGAIISKTTAEKIREQTKRQEQRFKKEEARRRISQNIKKTVGDFEAGERTTTQQRIQQAKAQGDLISEIPQERATVIDKTPEEVLQFVGPPAPTKTPIGSLTQVFGKQPKTIKPKFPVAGMVSGTGVLFTPSTTKVEGQILTTPFTQITITDEPKEVKTPLGSIEQIFGRTPFEQKVVKPLKEFRTPKEEPKGFFANVEQGLRDVGSNVGIIVAGAGVAAGKEAQALITGKFEKVGKVGQQFFEKEIQPGLTETVTSKLIEGKVTDIDITQPRQVGQAIGEIGLVLAPIPGVKGVRGIKGAATSISQRQQVSQVAKQIQEKGIPQGIEKLGKDVFLIGKGTETKPAQVPLTVIRFGKEAKSVFKKTGEVLEIRPKDVSLVPSEIQIRGSVDPTTKGILRLSERTKFQFESKQLDAAARKTIQQAQFSGGLKTIAEGRSAPLKVVRKGQTDILRRFVEKPTTTLFGETRAQKIKFPEPTKRPTKLGRPFTGGFEKSTGAAGGEARAKTISAKTEQTIKDLLTPPKEKPKPTTVQPSPIFTPLTTQEQIIRFPPETKQTKQRIELETVAEKGLTELEKNIQRVLPTQETTQRPTQRQISIPIIGEQQKTTQPPGLKTGGKSKTKPLVTQIMIPELKPDILPKVTPQTIPIITPTTTTITTTISPPPTIPIQPPPRAPPIIKVPKIPFFPFLGPGGLRSGLGGRPTTTRKKFVADPADPFRAGVISAAGVDQLVGTNEKVFKQIDINLAKARGKPSAFDPLLGFRFPKRRTKSKKGKKSKKKR